MPPAPAILWVETLKSSTQEQGLMRIGWLLKGLKSNFK